MASVAAVAAAVDEVEAAAPGEAKGSTGAAEVGGEEASEAAVVPAGLVADWAGVAECAASFPRLA